MRNEHSDRPQAFETPELEREQIERLRNMTLDERGQLVADACRLASDILNARRAMGIPDLPREPWPESTIQLLERWQRAESASEAIAARDTPEQSTK